MEIRVGHKLVAGFGLLILLIFGLGWYQLDNVERTKTIAIRAVDGDVDTLDMLRQLGVSRRDMATLLEKAWVAHLLRKAGASTDDPLVFTKERAIAAERTRALGARLYSLTEQRLKTSVTPGRMQIWTQIRTAIQAMQASNEEIIKAGNDLLELMRRDDATEYKASSEILTRLRRDAATQELKVAEMIDELGSTAEQTINELSSEVRTNSIIVLIGVLVVAVIIAFVLHRSITAPLRGFMQFAEKVGAGDLTRRLDSNRKDELGRLGSHLNEMAVSLNSVASQIRAATENLNVSTAEMQASVQQHAAGTTEQNAAVQQITSTLSEITRSGAQISDRAKNVAQTAEAAATASKSGIHAVNETTRAMDLIREQAEKVATNIVALTERTQSIGAIIATVNDLAERSNLLALNAAIEAAAAGEHGQSFAVVADEMKNLAGQAKDATIEVRTILSDVQHRIGTAVMQTEEAVKRVDSGKTQAVATEQTITELARSVEQSVATFEQIVAATAQQQVGIEQVTQSVHNIREASEQMASGSKEVGRAASNLAAISSQLQSAVERYRV